ncbi:BA75_01768T0 [Komagataella pastoris]|uniref:BA75_01768T0 n=1 Tax=Komagataella pastoris TaxID=4922 RepID=A0A1B2J9U4_PICPA|nr:BA75_01768T0 [Komagataella pastoris]
MDLGYDSADEDDTETKDLLRQWQDHRSTDGKDLGMFNDRVSLFIFVNVPLVENEMVSITKLVGQINQLFNDTYLCFEPLKTPLHISLSQNLPFQTVDEKDRFCQELTLESFQDNPVRMTTKAPYLFQSITSSKIFLSIKLGGETLKCLGTIVGQINQHIRDYFTAQESQTVYSPDNLHISIGVFKPTTKVSSKDLDEFNRRLLRWNENTSANPNLFPEIWLSSPQCSTIGV